MSGDTEKLDRLPESAPDISSADPADKELGDREQQDLKRAAGKLKLEGERYELGARKTYGKLIFALVVAWIVAVLVLVFLAGYSERPLMYEFKGPTIPDSVLIALITGMSVNVIALLAVVINYLFPKRPESK
ncbi:MAG: hypothetical protein KJ749_12945 [Planctomycetes bacterium]|nr:hypothetical protein [Planctomycetota bacterium]